VRAALDKLFDPAPLPFKWGSRAIINLRDARNIPAPPPMVVAQGDFIVGDYFIYRPSKEDFEREGQRFYICQVADVSRVMTDRLLTIGWFERYVQLIVVLSLLTFFSSASEFGKYKPYRDLTQPGRPLVTQGVKLDNECPLGCKVQMHFSGLSHYCGDYR
jgi:hypothetical protein